MKNPAVTLRRHADLPHWDATLSNAQVVNRWLATWILSAAEDPGSVRAVVVEHNARGIVIDLTGSDGAQSDGIASGGVLLYSVEGCVHVLGAVDRDKDPRTKRRTVEELIAAREIAFCQRRRSRRWELCGKVCVVATLYLVTCPTDGGRGNR